MHVVTEQPTGTVYVNLETGKKTPSVIREELWTDRDARRIHLVMSEGGQVVGDLLLPQDAARSKTAFPPDPGLALASFWTHYSAALRSGAATLDKRGHIRGRPVYWLRYKSAPPTAKTPHLHPSTLEVAVDAHSYRPILSRTTFNGRHYDERILAARAIGYHAADFRRQGPSLLASTSLQGTSSWQTGTSSSRPFATQTTVHPPWLTAGKTVAGLRLGAAIPLTATRKHKPTIHGIELVYGGVKQGLAAANSTTVDELPRGDPMENWKNIPAGSIQIETSQGSGSSETIAHPHPRNTTFTDWTGYLTKDKLYVTIDTTKGERALLAIARNLRRPRG